MKIKIIKGKSGFGREILVIESENTRIVVGFGEEKGTGDIAEKNNPIFEGLTIGEKSYDGIFILRNPENCALMNYSLNTIPIYLERKLKSSYDICMDFYELTKKTNIKIIAENESINIKDLEINFFVVDPSNYNTSLLRVKDNNSGKTVVVSGDFKDYDGKYKLEKLNNALSIISSANIVVVEGKYLGRQGAEYSSGKELFKQLINIMKFYKQVFIIQSETDLIMTSNIYQSAIKSKKIFVESTLLCNLTTVTNGSCPSPFNNKKVYSYNPLVLENNNSEFKKKYVVPFFINRVMDRLKKEKYVMNVTKDFLQDIQLFEKEGSLYDACVILAEWKGFVDKDSELKEFIDVLKKYEVDYYELYTHGKVNIDILNKIILKVKADYVVPLDFNGEQAVASELNCFKVLQNEEEINI